MGGKVAWTLGLGNYVDQNMCKIPISTSNNVSIISVVMDYETFASD
jgi:hypothetical protein